MSDSGQNIHSVPQWQQWHMNQLSTDKGKPAGTVKPANTAKVKAVPKPKNAETQAREKGFKEGVTQGKKEGLQAGLEEGRSKGFEQGLEEGRAAARQENAEEIKRQLKFLLPLAENFANAINLTEEDVATDLVELAMSIGNQLALGTLKTNPQVILKLVKDLFNIDLNPTARPQLILNPEDLQLVEEHLGDELANMGWQTKGDESISRGGCLVKSHTGEINATWEARWEALMSRKRQRASENSPVADEGQA